MTKWSQKEVDAIKRKDFIHHNREFTVQLMDEQTKEILKEKSFNGWVNAHKKGAKILKKAPDGQILRIFDPKDASYVDFLTKDRLKKLIEGGKYLGSEENSE